MKNHIRFNRTALSIAAAQTALLCGGAVWAQDVPTPEAAASAPAAKAKKADAKTTLDTVVVTGQRRAIETAQSIKQNAEEIVDSIVADDIGKLPDRSVTEVLQRIVGVTISRVKNGDPNSFTVEGTGVMVRGLSYVRGELNGRGSPLSWEDVTPELVAGVDLYKNPSAEQIEGGISGLVNLRTAMPFDYAGFKGGLSARSSYNKLRQKQSPAFSALLSNRWDTDLGSFGALIDVAVSKTSNRTDGFGVDTYFPRIDIQPGRTLWVPSGATWNQLLYDRNRKGLYAAAQWKKGGVESSLSYFRSQYDVRTEQAGVWNNADKYRVVFDNAKWSDDGVLLAGTEHLPGTEMMQYSTSSWISTNKQTSEDLSWALKWKLDNRWTFNSDLQFTRTRADNVGLLPVTGFNVQNVDLDLTTAVPTFSFDATERARLADPNNHWWDWTMEFLDKSKLTTRAWRGDAKFQFDDPVLRDLRFGIRFTEQTSKQTTADRNGNWASIGVPWNANNATPKLGDPRFSAGTVLNQFPNYFNGNAAGLPPMWKASPDYIANYPASFQQLHGYAVPLCNEAHKDDATPFNCDPGYSSIGYNDNPQNVDSHSERTVALHGTLRFGFDDLPYPVEGNVGLRVVKTTAVAHGYTSFTPLAKPLPPGVPEMSPVAEFQDFENSYVDVLPSLNLKMNASDKLQFRLAISRGISRPAFGQLAAKTTLTQGGNIDRPSDGLPVLNGEVTYTGTATGNPLLKPVKSSNLDLTAEWYPAKSSSLTTAVFYKSLKDIVMNQAFIKTIADNAGQDHFFTVTGPANAAKGWVRGIELGGQTYLSSLPGWLSGFGVAANYTYVDSKQTPYQPVFSAYCQGGNNPTNFNLFLNGCDTDGRAFGSLPIQNLSRNAFNLNLLYDYGGLSARVAYNWRGRYLAAVSPNGGGGGDGNDIRPDSPDYNKKNIGYGIPIWVDNYATMDIGVSYKFDSGVSIGFDVNNATDTINKRIAQQHVGMLGRWWSAPGPQYSLSARYTF
ncbi:MAG TPA: TonB-dependent receptor [Roseateles sp.]